jgi:hypothetical protein
VDKGKSVIATACLEPLVDCKLGLDCSTQSPAFKHACASFAGFGSTTTNTRPVRDDTSVASRHHVTSGNVLTSITIHHLPLALKATRAGNFGRLIPSITRGDEAGS